MRIVLIPVAATAAPSAASKTPNNEKATYHAVCCCVGVEPQFADTL